MSAPAYSERVEALVRDTPGAGRPEAPGWVSGEAREPLTGTHVRIHLRGEGGRVAEARYEVRGCPHTIAATALVAGGLPGRAIESPLPDMAPVAAELGAPTAKLGRFFVIQDAVHNALVSLGRRGP